MCEDTKRRMWGVYGALWCATLAVLLSMGVAGERAAGAPLAGPYARGAAPGILASEPLTYTTLLPVIVSGYPPPTATPTATPTTPVPADMPGYNATCRSYGATKICASVSDPSPVDYDVVTAYGMLLIDGAPQAGRLANILWHFRSRAAYCLDNTDAGGLAQCSKSVGTANRGYTVTVDVGILGYSVSTWFVPH